MEGEKRLKHNSNDGPPDLTTFLNFEVRKPPSRTHSGGREAIETPSEDSNVVKALHEMWPDHFMDVKVKKLISHSISLKFPFLT